MSRKPVAIGDDQGDDRQDEDKKIARNVSLPLYGLLAHQRPEVAGVADSLRQVDAIRAQPVTGRAFRAHAPVQTQDMTHVAGLRADRQGPAGG